FHILRLIGRGAYGKVFLVQHKLSGQYYAMKAIHKAFVTEDTRNIELTRAERTILEDVQHPFIVRLFYAFQTDHRLYLILEYIPGGELFHHLYHECMFPERVARFFIAEVVCALEHLHTLGIIYRDLKPENCLIDREGHLVLTDFGLSKLGLPSNGKTSTFCGTTEYMAPEILNEQPYDQAVDWWSLGILLFDMITGSPPFTGDNKNSVMNAIRRAQLKFPRYVSPAARQLVQALLHKDPAKRLGTFTGPITTHRARRPMPSGGGGLGRRHSRIRQHKFFDGLDWAAVEARTVKSPIIPKIRGDDDTSNFSTEFTSQPIAESP
ncbi:kinase-like domain-containing protein, partial [Dimargaris cristalligena]